MANVHGNALNDFDMAKCLEKITKSDFDLTYLLVEAAKNARGQPCPVVNPRCFHLGQRRCKTLRENVRGILVSRILNQHSLSLCNFGSLRRRWLSGMVELFAINHSAC